MARADTLHTVDVFWSSYFDCRADDLHTRHTLVLPHAAMTGYQGAFLFRHAPSCIVSVPPALVEPIAGAVAGRAPAEVFNAAFILRVLGDAVERLIGPAWLGYADHTDFHPAAAEGVRLLEPSDEGALRRLAHACDDVDWEHSGIQFDRSPIFGCLMAGEIVAAAGYEIWGERLAHVGVVTHPWYRGKGYGKRVVSAITGHGLGQGLLMQYRTLKSNVPSLAIGRSLGYWPYAATLAVRLKRAALDR